MSQPAAAPIRARSSAEDVPLCHALADFEKKVYSQNGEDGITLRILELLGCDTGFYLEIGTESGVECNSRILRDRPGFPGIMLDGTFEDPSINLHREFVTVENIRDLCDRYGVPSEIALLSIDIDGNDYWIWKTMAPRVSAQVVIIEYNAALGAVEHRVMPYDPGHRWNGTDYYGASISALAALGQELGYSLVYADANGVNLFFVHNEALDRSRISFRHQNKPVQLFRPPRYGPHGRGHPRAQREVPLVGEHSVIPRVIHQTETTADLPPEFSPRWTASWREMNPGWEYCSWTDAGIDRFVRDEFPDFQPVFNSYGTIIQRADAFRYLVLKRFGGVFASLDSVCLKPLDVLLTGQYLLFGTDCRRDGTQGPGHVRDAFMAGAPDHPFWDGITVDLARHASLDALHATGFHFLTGRIERALAFLDPGSYPAIAEPELLYPLQRDNDCKVEARNLSREELATRYPDAFAVMF